MPLAKVFLRVLAKEMRENSTEKEFAAAFRDAVSLTATHEIAEMLVDPAVTLCVQRPGFGLYGARGGRSRARKTVSASTVSR